MAIGLGLMFGFKYKENFNFPYGALSIQEFWRKWHISLSSWFRGYVYIPLGGSYKSNIRTKMNLIIIFSLCGLWHGANYTFVIWGLFHGLFLILERTGFGRFMAKLPNLVRHIYVLFVVTIGWVFFREENLPTALGFIKTMLVPDNLDINSITTSFNIVTAAAIVIGIILAMGANLRIKDYLVGTRNKNMIVAYKQLSSILGLGVLLISILLLSTNSYNPFLYFRF
jgi:alginate O-acetyltransferase complex protein AlgI